MKVKINNLFGKYNNVLNLDNKCNIYIGENGIGKSTSIKIFNALFKLDFIELKNYYFESIEIIDDNEIITVRYKDLTLNKEYLIKQFAKEDYEVYQNIKKEFEEIKKEKKVIDTSQIYSNDVEQQSLIYTLNNNYDFENFLNHIDNRLLYKILKFNKRILKNEKIIKYFEDNGAATFYLQFIENQYKNAKINTENGKYYIESGIKEKFNTIKNKLNKLQYKNVLFIDMASDIEVINELERKYAFNEFEKNSIDDNAKEIAKYNENQTSILDMRKDFRRKSEIYSKLSNKEFIELLKNNYRIKSGIGLENNKIDLGYFLFNNIYTAEKQNEFKNDFYDFIYNNIKNLENSISYNINDMLFNKIKNYIYPLVDNNNILGEVLNEILPDNWNIRMNYESADDLQLLLKFYEKYEHKYISIKDDRLEKLNNLFRKYFKNKEIIATPFGICISTKELNNDICFEELSLGERKIIILFTIAVFSEDSIVLLDEPEASLSIVWQEQLIMDIIENTNYKNLIVATQSPYVIENESLDEYIIPLIDGEYDE